MTCNIWIKNLYNLTEPILFGGDVDSDKNNIICQQNISLEEAIVIGVIGYEFMDEDLKQNSRN